MKNIVEVEYVDLDKNEEFEKLIKRIVEECFKQEDLDKSKLYISITLTTPNYIKQLNQKYRNINSETDVLSFPMFEKAEIQNIKDIQYREALGDIVISIDRVKKQAEEYGHSMERELAYMVVHGFYHLMGEDHIKEEDKIVMRKKEENILNKLNIIRQ